MPPKTHSKIQEIIAEVASALPASRGSEAIERRLRQALALLHAAADTLEELPAQLRLTSGGEAHA